MNTRILLSLLLLGASSHLFAADAATGDKAKADKEVAKALQFEMKKLDGEKVKLAEYEDKVVMIVNVASECGLTPQYKQLQNLHEKYGEKGLAILGFPCNQFGAQEPGSSKEIQTFCAKNYGVKFDMFEKVDVNGDDACDLYKYLTKLDLKPQKKGNVSWNFEKFLLDREGNVIARFPPRTKPDDKTIVSMIEKALGEKTEKRKAS